MAFLKNLPAPSYRVSLFPAACSLDLGDGSERGEYVDQDYLLASLGRPHRSISLMYCYYPFDKGWPRRASHAHKPRGGRAWPYPYDDYFPFSGGPGGDPDGDAFRQMRDVRRHGQEATLTLTADCAVPDAHLREIARQLRPYGRMRLRLNHECDGFWFAFNRRYGYAQVAAFFVRFARILKKEAPLARMMGCWGHVEDFRNGCLKHEKALSPILPVSDVWSTDKYLTLHYGWPRRGCEPGDLHRTYTLTLDREVWRQIEGVHRRFAEIAGKDRGLEIGEFNADGDVGGEAYQARRTAAFYRKVLRDRPPFLKGITYYQFRDRGRLGLEREDPNHPGNGLPTPFLAEYRKLLREPYFNPGESWSRLRGGLRMEWRSSDDSDGLGWRIPLKGRPLFLELLLEKEANLMVRAGHKWHYKKPGVEWLDVTGAAAPWGPGRPFPIVLFAPPAEGVNPRGESAVGMKLTRPPRTRIHYAWKAHKSRAR
jgi:hypothetical protein